MTFSSKQIAEGYGSYDLFNMAKRTPFSDRPHFAQKQKAAAWWIWTNHTAEKDHSASPLDENLPSAEEQPTWFVRVQRCRIDMW